MKNLDNSASLWVMASHLPRFAFICTATALSACSEPMSESDEGVEPYLPEPRYAQQDGDLFMYVGEASEEASTRGDSSPVVTIRYLGQDGGQHRLEMVDDDGSRLGVMECSYPCRVAKQTGSLGTVTRVAVNRGTIIEAAFQDAFNGFLMVASSPAQPATVPQVARAVPKIESSPVSDWRGERGNCRLIVGGSTYITGDCWTRMEGEGSFQIMSLDEQYFAQLLRSDSEALGFWNETPGSSHAHSALGELERSGACWKNAEAELCAWEPK